MIRVVHLPYAVTIVCVVLLIAAAVKISGQRRIIEQYRSEVQKLQQDWPGLLRFRDDDTALTKRLAGKPPEAVFLGDSITEFWDLRTWFPGRKYVNRGIQTQTTPQILIRFRQDVIDLRPKLVVIHAGTNDIAGNTGPATLKMIEDNLQSMTELARMNGIMVLLASALPIHDYGEIPASNKRSPERIADLNRWMQNYCQQSRCYYVDYWSAMTDNKGMLRRELSQDGVHPNANGYAIMTNVASQAITQALHHNRGTM